MGDTYDYLHDYVECELCGAELVLSNAKLEKYTDASGNTDTRWVCDGFNACKSPGSVVLKPKATDVQEGGDHYKKQKIQPIEYITANGLGFCEGNVVKYITRYKQKDGVKDLKKARHYINILIEQIEQEQEAQSHP